MKTNEWGESRIVEDRRKDQFEVTPESGAGRNLRETQPVEFPMGSVPESGHPRRRLAICLPQRQNVTCYYSASLLAMGIHLGSHPGPFENVSIVAKGSSMLPHLRCQIAEEAIGKHNATDLLWIDDDHSFPENTVDKLFMRDKAIVGINASTRALPIKSTARVNLDEHLYTTSKSTGIERCYSLGFGIILVRREVFESIKPPWFRISCEDGGSWIGEDAWFCAKARAAGYELWVDHDLTKETLHHGLVGFHSKHAAEQAGVEPESEGAVALEAPNA